MGKSPTKGPRPRGPEGIVADVDFVDTGADFTVPSAKPREGMVGDGRSFSS